MTSLAADNVSCDPHQECQMRAIIWRLRNGIVKMDANGGTAHAFSMIVVSLHLNEAETLLRRLIDGRHSRMIAR